MVFKSFINLAPEYLGSKLTSRSMTTAYTFRDSENKLAILLPRTNYLRNSFTYSGAVLWNSLPQNLRQAESLSNFKTLLNKHYRKYYLSHAIETTADQKARNPLHILQYATGSIPRKNSGVPRGLKGFYTFNEQYLFIFFNFLSNLCTFKNRCQSVEYFFTDSICC